MAPPLSGGRMVMLWSLLREAIARPSRGVIRGDQFLIQVIVGHVVPLAEKSDLERND